MRMAAVVASSSTFASSSSTRSAHVQAVVRRSVHGVASAIAPGRSSARGKLNVGKKCGQMHVQQPYCVSRTGAQQQTVSSSSVVVSHQLSAPVITVAAAPPPHAVVVESATRVPTRDSPDPNSSLGAKVLHPGRISQKIRPSFRKRAHLPTASYW